MKVNVVILTYNHEKFIAKAIDSVLKQKTSFDFTILISDDNSTDSTPLILNQYQEKYPDKIKLYKNESNQGVRYNVIKMMEATSAEYTALLDGDDYWTFEKKLQQQVAFLDQHKDYVGAYHDASILHEDQDAENYLYTNLKAYSQSNFYKTDTYPSDLVKRLIIPTSSIVFRTKALDDVDKSYFTDSYSVAWKLIFFISLRSKFRYFNETWSNYRNHKIGISKTNEEDFYLSHITFLKKLLKEKKYWFLKEDIYKSICHQYHNLFTQKNKRNPSLKYRMDYTLALIINVFYDIKRIF